MVRKHTKRHKKSSRHKRSLHRRKHRVKTRRTHHKKRHRRESADPSPPSPCQGGCGQCVSGANMFWVTTISLSRGPASMNGEAAPGSNYYAKLQQPNPPEFPKSTNGGTDIVKKVVL